MDLNHRRRRVFAAFLESVVLAIRPAGQGGAGGPGGQPAACATCLGCCRVRTVSPLEIRAQRLARQEGLGMDRARQLATVVDQQRRAYIAHVFGADWSSPLSYDLVLNMGRLSLEQAATTVLDLAAHSAFDLSAESQRLLADTVLASRVRRELVAELDLHALEVQCNGSAVVLTGYAARTNRG